MNPENLLDIQEGKLNIKEQQKKKTLKTETQMESIKLTTHQVGEIITQKWVLPSDVWTQYGGPYPVRSVTIKWTTNKCKLHLVFLLIENILYSHFKTF